GVASRCCVAILGDSFLSRTYVRRRKSKRQQGIRAMAQCEYCDKKPSMGNQVEHRGKAKYLGGVGTKVTGISRREFKPNLQRVKITTPNGTTRYARVCTRCLKKGVVRKAIQQA